MNHTMYRALGLATAGRIAEAGTAFGDTASTARPPAAARATPLVRKSPVGGPHAQPVIPYPTVEWPASDPLVTVAAGRVNAAA